MTEKRLLQLCDMATEAHTQIQQAFKDINPIVGVSKNMRDIGIPADAMMIDCLKSRKRIILILHDEQADIIRYQFSFIDKDPHEKFETIAFDELNSMQIFTWIKNYFS